MNDLKMLILIIGLHTFAISLCALVIKLIFIACVYFYAGIFTIELNDILLFMKAGALGGFITGIGVWLIYRFNSSYRK